MIRLENNKGIPRGVLLMMSVMAGFTVANLYYNQPLIEMISVELGVNHVMTNLITVFTQVGYAAGLLFVVSMGDLYSRRRIILTSLVIAAGMLAMIGLTHNIYIMWVSSLVMGACSVAPQLFIPMASQFSRPEHKARNMGYVLSGLLTGVLGARVLSGLVGEWVGWRAMFLIAAGLMVVCALVSMWLMPVMARNYEGSYWSLLKSVVHIFATHKRIRLNSFRVALGFGSMISIWACMAFHVASAPFYAGSDVVGMLGLCGVVGAITASGVGKYVHRFSIKAFSIAGAAAQLLAWTSALLFGNTYIGLIVAIILADLGMQCLQLSNQSACLHEIPEANNRVNTIFMTIYFVGGSVGTFCAAWGWKVAGWTGVCAVGGVFALGSLLISAINKRN